jgi:hypothetical protein
MCRANVRGYSSVINLKDITTCPNKLCIIAAEEIFRERPDIDVCNA